MTVFINVLLGVDTNSDDLAAADLKWTALPDGLDIQPSVEPGSSVG